MPTAARPAPTKASRKDAHSNVTCACHWTVNVAASKVTRSSTPMPTRSRPSAFSCRPNSTIRTPDDLAGVPISVGYQSGSHYSTIQALEPYCRPTRSNCRSTRACCSGAWKPARRQGRRPARCSADLTICGAARLPQNHRHHLHDRGDDQRATPTRRMCKYFRALKRAQRDIDLRPELYTHYYKKEFPARFHGTHGYPPLGTGRAHRVRALRQRSVRAILRVDRQA